MHVFYGTVFFFSLRKKKIFIWITPLIILVIQYSCSKLLSLFAGSVAFSFFSLCFCSRPPDFQLLKKGQRFVPVSFTDLSGPGGVNAWTSCAGLLQRNMWHFSIFLCEGKMICLICLIYCTTVLLRKSNWSCWNRYKHSLYLRHHSFIGEVVPIIFGESSLWSCFIGF